MKIRWDRFNIYLLALLAGAWVCGCQTAEGRRKKEVSTLRIHIETRSDSIDKAEKVQIYRALPMRLSIEKQPFLNEAYIKKAEVVDAMGGGFQIRVEFERRGILLLEQYTSANRKKHLAIFSQWVDTANPKENIERWLAAPLIRDRITDGILLFTPDMTRDEAEQLAVGLNNVAKKNESSDTKW